MHVNILARRCLAVMLTILIGTIQFAYAQWSENFDSLLTNSPVAPNKGWETWDQSAGANSNTSAAFSTSSPNAIHITGTSDTIRRYQGYNGGHWEYKTKVYVPSTASGRSWFILMNKYVHGVHNNQDWSLQIAFNAATNAIYSQEANVTGTLIEDAWFDLRVDINLTANLAKIYVNNVLFAQHAWVGPNGINGLYRIECVDLYAEAATSVAYYDDMALNNLSDCCSNLINIAQDGGSTALGIPLGQLFVPQFTGHACDIITGIETFTASAYDLYIVNAPGGIMPTNFATNYIYRALNQTASNTSPNGPVNGTISAVNSQTLLFAGFEYALIAVPQNNMIAWHTLYVGTGGKGQYFYNNTTWVTMTDRHFSFRITGLKSKTVVTAGLADNYATPYDNVYRSPAFNAVYPGAVWRKFDEEDNNKWLGHTFTGLPGNIKRARLTFTAKTEPGSDATNDSISLGLLNNPSSPNPPPYWQWTRRLELLPESGGTWNTNGSTTFSVDLHNLPGGGNVVGMMNATGMLDVWIQDDTNVDNMVLEYWTCPANSNPLGGPWVTVGVATLAFDPVGHALIVDNIGSSGQDGVEINLGESKGVSWHIETTNDIRNNGVEMSVSTTVVDSETREETPISLTLRGEGGVAQILPDLGPPDGMPFELELLNAAGHVLRRMPYNPAMVVKTRDKSTTKLLEAPVRGSIQKRLIAEVELHESGQVDIGSESVFNVKTVKVSRVRRSVHFNTIKLQARGTGPVRISRFRPAFFDVFADFSEVGEWQYGTSLGNGGIEHVVHSIGFEDTGLQQGTRSRYALKRFTLRDSASVKPEFAIDASGAPIEGSSLVSKLLGPSVGNPEAVKSTFGLTRVGSFFDIFVDLSPMGATGNEVKVYSGSTLVGTVSNLPQIVGTSSAVHYRNSWGHVLGKKFWEAEFPANTQFQIGGSVFVGDKLVIEGMNATDAVEDLSKMEIFAGNAHQLRVTDVISETGTSTISGVVSLQDYEGSPPVVTIRIRARDSFSDLEVHAVQLSSDGSYSIETDLIGELDVTCEGPTWLRKMIPITIPDISGNVVANFSLKNGDCDGDNEVTLVDFGQVSAAFGSVEGDPTWNPDADLNGDGEVNLVDFGVLAANFGEAGDE